MSPGGVWTIVAHGPRAVEAMYASEGRCPSRGRLCTEAIERVYEENKWRPSMAFAWVACVHTISFISSHYTQ